MNNKTFYLDGKIQLDCYFIGSQFVKERKAIIVMPGGGYEFLADDREGESYAFYFASLGFVAFVLHYSVAPSTFPTQLLELYRALKFVKNEFVDLDVRIDINNIFLIGSSAGGYLALNSQTIIDDKKFLEKYQLDENVLKIRGLILCYPVVVNDSNISHGGTFINLLKNINDPYVHDLVSLDCHIHKDMPPIFCFTTYEDDLIEIENSLILAQRCKERGVNIELYIFAKGAHGLALGDQFNNPGTDEKVVNVVSKWPELVKNWLNNNF